MGLCDTFSDRKYIVEKEYISDAYKMHVKVDKRINSGSASLYVIVKFPLQQIIVKERFTLKERHVQ